MKKHQIHQLKIHFMVKENVNRFVYVYIIEADFLYLIDSGVYGCEKQIALYLKQIGRDISEIRAIFLTHAHPDHIGSAGWFQKNVGCKIYASAGEKRWIEDIDLQFKKRPIPNFYNLAGQSSKVDYEIKDGEEIELEKNLVMKVIRTAGHSVDEVSFQLQNSLFIGDSVLVKGDIPIFIDEYETRRTLDVILQIPNVDTYYPAWDCTYSKKVMLQKIRDARKFIDLLKETVAQYGKKEENSIVVDQVCECLHMPMLKKNPLFARTVLCLMEE